MVVHLISKIYGVLLFRIIDQRKPLAQIVHYLFLKPQLWEKNIAVHRKGYIHQYSENAAKNWVLISNFIGKYNALHFKESVSK